MNDYINDRSHIYCQPYQSLLKIYSQKLKSREHLADAVLVMGFDSIEAFIKKYAEKEENYKHGEFKDYRYQGAFESVQTFWDFIESKDLGSRN